MASEIIVVDDASTDQTAEVVAGFPGTIFVKNPFNRGYGASLKNGMGRASGRYIAWFDADNEHKVDDLIQMTDRLVSNKLAAVIGERSNPAPSAIRSLGKLLIKLLARSLGTSSVKDINCGLRVFHSDVISSYSSINSEQAASRNVERFSDLDDEIPF